MPLNLSIRGDYIACITSIYTPPYPPSPKSATALYIILYVCNTMFSCRFKLLRMLQLAIKGYTYQVQELVHCLECKICKDIPSQPMLALCCGQVIGCCSCFEQCINTSRSCPLCRAADTQSVAVNGYEGLYSQLPLMGGIKQTWVV